MESLVLPIRPCFLDFETTGLDPARDQVLEVGLRGGRVLDALVSDASPACEEALRVHGLSAAHCRTHGRPSAEVLRDLLAALGPGPVEVVAHRAAFEQAFLEAWAAREGATLPEIHWRCALTFARRLVPSAPFSLGLGHLATLLGWSTAGLHRAGTDALLAARLWEALTAWAQVKGTLGVHPGITYLAGPFRGDGSRRCMRGNLGRMVRLARWAQAVLPNAVLVIPHLNFAYLDEAGQGGRQVREQVLAACGTLVRASRSLILCGDSLTHGMRREHEAALASGVQVFRVPGWDAPAGPSAGATA
jgi:DNA polymerase III epsilon subunit-like protein